MFDDIKDTTGNGGQVMREPQDMFEKTDNTSSTETGSQEIFPASADQTQSVAPMVPLSGNESISNSKGMVLKIFLGLVIVGIVGIAGYLGYEYFFNKNIEPTNQDSQHADESEDQMMAEEESDSSVENIEITSPVVNEAIDTDNDGLTDAEEKIYGTDLDLPDSDNDGLFDREEIMVYETNPLEPDSDSDGYTDGVEVRSGYNPNGPGKLLPDTPTE